MESIVRKIMLERIYLIKESERVIDDKVMLFRLHGSQWITYVILFGYKAHRRRMAHHILAICYL